MLVCLFGPMIAFSIIGYKSLQTLGRRPSKASKVMPALVTKVGLAGAILMGILMLLVKFYGK